LAGRRNERVEDGDCGPWSSHGGGNILYADIS